MKMYELAAMQKELDEYIKENKQVDKTAKEINAWTKVALLVELGELANELRFFKFWSVRPYPKSYEKVREEYADCLHFALSLVNQEHERRELTISEEKEALSDIRPLHFNDLTTHFNHLFTVVNNTDKVYLLRLVLGLGQLLGLDGQDIKNVYLFKHSTNYQRQKTNY